MDGVLQSLRLIRHAASLRAGIHICPRDLPEVACRRDANRCLELFECGEGSVGEETRLASERKASRGGSRVLVDKESLESRYVRSLIAIRDISREGVARVLERNP